MNGQFHKTIFKKLITLLILASLVTESVMLPNMSTVYAAGISENAGTDTTKGETETTSAVDITTDSSSLEDSDKSTTNSASPAPTNEATDSATDITTAPPTDSTNQDSTSGALDTATENPSSEKDNAKDSIDAKDSKNSTDTDIEITAKFFPDDIFRDYIEKHFDTDSNKKLSKDEIKKVESIDVSNMGIRDLTGIEYFTNVSYLYCTGNKLSTLDVNALVNLTVLNCSYNYLTSLDLSKCSSLISLESNNNVALITLDEKNTFDLSTLKNFDTKLVSDWSKNIKVDNYNISLLEDENSSLITYHYAVNAPQLKDSFINFSFVIASDRFTNVEISETTFPDPSFREYVKENYDLDKDSILSPEELNAITYLYIPEKEIASLSGIEYFSNLTYLNFDHNAVTSVDLNSLSNLRGVSCNDNQLEQLLCQNLTNLSELYSNNNHLYSLDLSGCSSLETLECNNNVYEISSTKDIVDLSALSLLDLSRTSDWSEGTLNSDNTLLLEKNVQDLNATEERNVTYTYTDNAPVDKIENITFALKVTPTTSSEVDEQSIAPENALPETTTPSQDTILPETAPVDGTLESVIPPVTSAPVVTSYTVEFNSDGGNIISSQTITGGEKAIMPSNPIKAEHLFAGWYYGDVPYDFNTAISANTTLTARWNKVSPAKPSIKKLKNTKKAKMNITLKSVKDIEGYEISYSTYKNAKKKAIVVETDKTSFTISNLIQGKTYYVRVRTFSSDSTGEKVYSNYSKIKKLSIKKGLAEAKATSTSATIKSVKIANTDTVKISVKAKNIIKSKDNYYYLFALPSYKKNVSKSATPLASTIKSASFQFNTPLNQNTSDSLLYSKFMVAVKTSSGYKAISTAKYITNPQAIAGYTYPFPTASTKKGLQINASMLNDVKDLGVKNSAFNIPLDMIIAAPGEDNHRSGIDYEYNGETYWFRKGMISAYDSLFRKLERQDIVVTAIVLLGWRDDLTYLISPSGREPGHNYYNFNTSDRAARKQLEATFAFLAERYASDDGNGKVVNWIIGNEINSFDAWNYAGTKSLSKYTQLYANSYRLAYTAMKSIYSNVRVYIPLDQYWTSTNAGTFSGKEFLERFDSFLKESGDISWNLAYHAYPSPLTDPRFWRNENGMARNNENSPMITTYNIPVLTKYIKKHYGKNTRIILSEQGFTSVEPYGEDTQAAAMAYAYYLAEFDSMIDAFILSRHVDNIAETTDGLNLGLWSNRPGQVEEAYHRKYAWTVYKYMDTPDSNQVTKFALKIVGAKNWKKIIPNYKASKFKSMPDAN